VRNRAEPSAPLDPQSVLKNILKLVTKVNKNSYSENNSIRATTLHLVMKTESTSASMTFLYRDNPLGYLIAEKKRKGTSMVGAFSFHAPLNRS
jgi:hypothetical protein